MKAHLKDLFFLSYAFLYFLQFYWGVIYIPRNSQAWEIFRDNGNILKLTGVVFAQLYTFTKNHWIIHLKLVSKSHQGFWEWVASQKGPRKETCFLAFVFVEM